MLNCFNSALASASVFAVVQMMMSMPEHFIDLVEVDLGEHDLFLQAHGIVATAVERRALHAAEVADAGQRDGDQTVEEFVHPVAAQRDLDAQRHLFTNAEAGDRLLGLGDDGLLAGDQRQFFLQPS